MQTIYNMGHRIGFHRPTINNIQNVLAPLRLSKVSNGYSGILFTRKTVSQIAELLFKRLGFHSVLRNPDSTMYYDEICAKIQQVGIGVHITIIGLND